MRVSPAMILADSIRQTASIARCVSVAVTATHHTIFNPLLQVERGKYTFVVIRRRVRTLPARKSGEFPSRLPTLASISCAVP